MTAPTLQADEHVLHFVFAFRLQPGAGESLAEVAGAWRTRLLAARPNPLPKAGWQALPREVARKRIQPDLMAAVDRLLNGGDAGHGDGQGNRPGHAPFTGLTPLMLDAEFSNHRFLIGWKASARERLRAAGLADELIERIGIHCAGATIHTFASGFALLVLTVRCLDLGHEKDPLPSAVIEEALYALGTAPDRGPPLQPVIAEWHRCPQPIAAGTPTVIDPTLQHAIRAARPDEAAQPQLRPLQGPRTLLRAVTPGAEAAPDAKHLTLLAGAPELPCDLYSLAGLLTGEADCPALTALQSATGHRRLFSYAAVCCAGAPPAEALGDLAWRLSRRFTHDYQPAAAERAGSAVQPFANIVHTASTQGGAAVAGDSGASFFRGFVSGSASSAYLPLALLAYHEYLYLQHLSQDCAFLPDPHDPAQDKTRIQELRTALARFRLYFRYAHVSDMGHHNQIHQGWRRALDLDAMLAELALDVREADQVLEHHHREHQARRWRIAGALTAVLGGFVVVHELLEALLPLLHPPLQGLLLALKGDGRDWHALEHDPALHAAVGFVHRLHATELWLAFGALVAAVGFGVVAWKKGPKLEE